MFNITVALKLWADIWKDRVVCIHCDNQGALTVCGSGKTKGSFLNWCLHSLWFNAARNNIQLRVVHIAGRENVIADALSRNTYKNQGGLQWEKVPNQAFDLFL